MTDVSRRRSTLFNLIGSVLNTLILSIQGVVLIPLYLHELGPRLFGAWLAAAELLLWMQVLDVGIQSLMIQRIGEAHGKRDFLAVGAHFATGSAMLAMVAALATGLGLAVSFPLPGWLGLSGDDATQLRDCFQAGIAATACIILSNSAAWLAKGTQSTALMNISIVLASLVGLAFTVGLMLTGWGLWSISLGIVARAVVSIVLNAAFAAYACRNGMCRQPRVRRDLFQDYLRLFPLSACGGIGFGMMNQSEAFLVGVLLSPELAPILALTRKGAEIVRSCVEIIGSGSYGSFAHLVASPQRSRALQVHAEITGLWVSLALAGAITYMTINSSLISVWVDSTYYGGNLLTVLIAVQLIVGGCAFLQNLLYRASGQVYGSVIAIVVECIVRLPLMIGLLLCFGLPGLPLAAIITSLVAGIIVYRLTLRRVSAFALPIQRDALPVQVTRAVLFLAGMFACVLVVQPSWSFVLVMAGVVSLGTSLVLVYTDPVLGQIRAPVTRMFLRLRGIRQQKNA